MGLRYEFESSIGYWVVPAARALERALNEELAPLGLTVRQFQVIARLIREPDVSQADLARRLGIEPPTLTGVLDRMERDRWIAREPCPKDRRQNRVRLLPGVRPVWRRMAACARRVRRRAMHGVTPEQFAAVRDVLGSLRANLDPRETRA